MKSNRNRSLKKNTQSVNSSHSQLSHGKGKSKQIAHSSPPAIIWMAYHDHHHEMKAINHIDDILPFSSPPTVSWLHFMGDNQADELERLSHQLSIHPLIIEDILHTRQRPKMDDMGDYVFMILKYWHWKDDREELAMEQVSLIIGKNYLLSFQESAIDIFKPVRERIISTIGKIHRSGSDYLAYTLIDAIVDHYFEVLESIEDNIEALEETIIQTYSPDGQEKIHLLKRQLLTLRKSIWPLREIFNLIQLGDVVLMNESTKIYFRDVHDHTMELMDSIDTCRDILASLMDIYLSSISNHLNEVMKVLSLIATIFIPLTFIVGIYGMNFRFMPELEWKWGYPIIWGIMIASATTMIVYFRKKHWL